MLDDYEGKLSRKSRELSRLVGDEQVIQAFAQSRINVLREKQEAIKQRFDEIDKIRDLVKLLYRFKKCNYDVKAFVSEECPGFALRFLDDIIAEVCTPDNLEGIDLTPQEQWERKCSKEYTQEKIEKAEEHVWHFDGDFFYGHNNDN